MGLQVQLDHRALKDLPVLQVLRGKLGLQVLKVFKEIRDPLVLPDQLDL
jgi:hypothetical protein